MEASALRFVIAATTIVTVIVTMNSKLYQDYKNHIDVDRSKKEK